MILSIVMDGLLSALLIATLVYCIRLNRRLQAIRDARQELGILMANFNTATEKARRAVVELKAAADATALDLKERIGKGRTLADELSIMTHAGERLADRLEQGFAMRKAQADGGEARTEGNGLDPSKRDKIQPAPHTERRAASEPLGDRERELLQTLRRVK